MHGIFGAKHLILLVAALICVVLGTLISRKWPLQRLAKVLLGIGLVSEFIKVFYYIIANEETYGGILPKTDLPFHLCSIQILFVAVLVYSKNRKLQELLMAFMVPSCLLGGLAALVIATTSSLNGGWILSVQYFGYHAAIMVFALVLMLGDQFKMTVKHYVNCIKFLMILLLFAIYINSILYDGQSNINFMYVASPPQSGLPFLTEKYGWLVYFCHYAFTVIFCVTLCYIRPIFLAIRGKLAKTPVK